MFEFVDYSSLPARTLTDTLEMNSVRSIPHANNSQILSLHISRLICRELGGDLFH